MGGAREMIADGVLDSTGARSAFGVHLWSGFPVGTLHVRPGPIMAAQDVVARFVDPVYPTSESKHLTLPP